ncbi:type VI secretion system ImpA family N-terminal domain-containing protein [Phyllobacterium sp. SB3]|uniref:type VI secretion system protein TssA n=1 Tax=Phyllobacterium sp. SB3 TaxID=3156073 RepID=UPI0032AF91F6
MNNYEILGVAFAGENPCGVNLRIDSKLVAVYQAIRDARSNARSEDRTIENPAIISQDDDRNSATTESLVHRPSVHWRTVHDLSFDALSLHTKDIEIFAWLMEAAVRVEGIQALTEILAAFDKMVHNHFAQLHSIDDEDLADKLAPLTGLNGSQDDGTLVRPLRLVSMLPNEIYGRFSLWAYDQAFRDLSGPQWAEFRDALEHVDGHAFGRMKNDANRALAILASIDEHLTEESNGNAGAFSVSRIQAVLESISGAYSEMEKLVAHVPQAPASADAPAEAQNPGQAAPVAIAAKPAGPIQNREQAFDQLLQVANFFRTTEPNSSLPFALETLVRRGRMDFVRLLEELIPHDELRRDVMIRAGIDPVNRRE